MIVTHKDHMLVVNEETPSSYIGYDVFTGDLTQLLKSECIDSTEPIKRLISDEKVRVLLSWKLGKTVKKSSAVFGCTVRTFQRLLKKYVYE